MNVVLVSKNEIHDNKATLCDERAKHLVKVLKVEVGDSIRVGQLHGRLGRGRILGIRKKYPFQVELGIELHKEPPAKIPVDLLLALPRPIMLRRIFSQATTLGFGALHIVNANRVEKSFWNSGLLEEREYLPQLVHGLEQAGDSIPPRVYFHRHFRPFIEDYFPSIANRYSHQIYAHPGASKLLHQIPHLHSGKILLAIGPEGGWVDYEIGKFQESGFSDISIGSRILRVDTAVINIHGRIMAELER